MQTAHTDGVRVGLRGSRLGAVDHRLGKIRCHELLVAVHVL